MLNRDGLVICKDSIVFSVVHNDSFAISPTFLLIFVAIASIWCFQERFLSIKACSKHRSIHAPNLIDELSTERRLNQFGSAGQVWCGKQH